MAARIHVLRQQEADLKVEAKALLDKASQEGNRKLTADEAARCDAIEAELNALKPEIAREVRFQDAERAAGGRIEMGVDHASERPWGPKLPERASAEIQTQARQAALGEFAIAVKNVATGRGADPRLFAVATGMGTAIPSDGAFAIPTELAPGIETYMFEGGELLSRVDSRTITGNNMAYVVINETDKSSTRAGGVLHYWVDEGTAPTASKPTLARVEFKLRKVGCLGYATDELIADAAALGGELEKHFSYELTFGVEDAITEGNGVNKPLGYLGAPCLVTVSAQGGQTAATIVGPNITNMWARLSARSAANAVWLANRDTIPQLAILTTAVGTGGFAYPYASVSNGAISLWGRPVVFTEYNATLGTIGDLVLIDLSQYRLIRKGGVEQASSIHVLFSSGEQTFRAFYRCDGAMMPRSAVTPFKGGSTKTLSPCVVLATRS